MRLNLLQLKINRHLNDLHVFRIIKGNHYIMNKKTILFITFLLFEIKADISKTRLLVSSHKTLYPATVVSLWPGVKVINYLYRLKDVCE